ncbi:hypothetical protein [Flavisphingomonas formosensis]|uniref:hypothetical protein n=1 Tax=Flavisphingomonas formosensis TaxID=861534 RepID=UPI0012FCB888|nr:hypothetical protein [Sphingomonas formosensis]
MGAGERLHAALGSLHRRPRLRRALAILLLALAALFLIRSVRVASAPILLAALDPTHFALLGGIALVYAGLLGLLARAWSLVPASRGRAIGWREAVAVYGVSILPKYLPGSVLQYGSRQLLGQSRGWDGPGMGRASLLEVTLHLLCCSAVALPLLLAAGAPRHGLAVMAGAILLAALLLVRLVRGALAGRLIVRCAALQLGFFAGVAALAAVAALSLAVPPAGLCAAGGLFLLAWLAGFVVPLAPGGLGVREAAGIALLAPVMGMEAALLLLASMRLAMLAGDALIALVALRLLGLRSDAPVPA